jgi:hypothetical protein
METMSLEGYLYRYLGWLATLSKDAYVFLHQADKERMFKFTK